MWFWKALPCAEAILEKSLINDNDNSLLHDIHTCNINNVNFVCMLREEEILHSAIQKF